MKQSFLVIVGILSLALADIGEKLRLGQRVESGSERNFDFGLQPPFSTIGDNHAAATSESDNEDNLDRLCNDPFHSFLCKPVGPRKNRIDGRLRSTAQIPPNVLNGSSSNISVSKQQPLLRGGALLSSGIQPSFSFDSPRVSALSTVSNEYLPPTFNNQQPLATQQFITKSGSVRPSNQYLPISSEPVLTPQDNVQLSLPLEQAQQNVYRYTPPSSRPVNDIINQGNKPIFSQQPQFPRPTLPPLISPPPQFPRPTLPPLISPPPQNLRPLTKAPISQIFFPTSTPSPTLSNRYLPIEPIDVRVSPASTNLSPLIKGSSLLSEGRQASPTENQQKKEERQHTLEELCNDAFHSFLCKPITQPRKRIDGKIRPGAKIPPHVLQTSGTFGSSSRKLPPLQSGSALLAEGREEPNMPQGYVYPKPQNPFISSQATNLQPVKNYLPVQQGIPTRIFSSSVSEIVQNPFIASQPTNQLPIQKFFVPSQQGTPQTIKPPTAKVISQNILLTNAQVAAQNTNTILSNIYQPQSASFASKSPYTTPRPTSSYQFITQRPAIPTSTFFVPSQQGIPERIPPPAAKIPIQSISSANQLAHTTNTKLLNSYQAQNSFQSRKSFITQRPFNANFQVTTPSPTQIAKQSDQGNFMRLRQVITERNFPSTPKTSTSNFRFTTSFISQKPHQLVNGQQNKLPGNYVQPKLPSNQFPIAQSAQISTHRQPFNNPNQISSQTLSGYVYPKPEVGFTLPTTTKRPIVTPSSLYIPIDHASTTKPKTSQTNGVNTTQKPITEPKPVTFGYDYSKPKIQFTLPARKFTTSPPPTTTQKAIPSNNQPVAITTRRPPTANNVGYVYSRPAQPFTLPTSTPSNSVEGYTYPIPDNPFTLPPRNDVTSAQQFGIKLAPIQTFISQLHFPVSNIINEEVNQDDPLPPASQFEILKP